jgi:hypothetical protein
MLKNLMAPLLGVAFVVFIPLIGIGMALYLLGRQGKLWLSGALAEAERVASPSWAPSAAYLSRNTPADKESTDASAPDEWRDDVEKKLDASDRNEP